MTAQQEWVNQLSIMKQSVIFAAVRAPDGIRKNHPVKVMMRWYRRCTLVSAFDGAIYDSPTEPGGGSFTGPFTADHAREVFGIRTDREEFIAEAFERLPLKYLEYVDELPHHFQLHLMHAAHIIAVYHPEWYPRSWWRQFYNVVVNDMHLMPEPDGMMAERLSDNEEKWRVRERAPAK